MRLLKYLPFIPLLSAYSAWSQIYLGAQAGYLHFNQETAAKNDVYPTGQTYGVAMGMRKDYLELEAALLKGSAESKITHDGKDNKLKHEQTSLLLGMNFYLNRRIYARFGYGLHKVDQSFASPMSPLSTAGAKEAYALVEDEVTEGIFYGAGLVLINGKAVSLFAQIERMDLSTVSAGAWNSSLGLRIYLD